MKDFLLALGAKPGEKSEKAPAADVEVDAGDSAEEPGMDGAGYEAAATEVMDAFHSGDTKMLSDALKSFVDMCK